MKVKLLMKKIYILKKIVTHRIRDLVIVLYEHKDNAMTL